jgi:phospholipase C
VSRRGALVVFAALAVPATIAVRLHRSSRQLLLAAVAFLLVMSPLSSGPTAAHNVRKTDRDDARGLLDLRSASVAHGSNVVVYSFRTFAAWGPSDLGMNSSGFIVVIDRNNDANQAERCVRVFFRSRLRATLLNCITGAPIGPVPVTKPNRTTVKVNIPKTQTGLSYRWTVVSQYFEKRPCLNGCFDGIPNLSSFILHDLAASPASATTTAGGQHEPSTPIEHFLVLMQENHSFDNYFGTYPGADGLPPATCMPRNPEDPSTGCVQPFHMGSRPALDLPHSRSAFLGQYRDGHMDGFVSALREEGVSFSSVMGYYDDREIPFYWNVADEYVLFDRFFSSAAGGSVWNHFFWVTGAPGNPKGDVLLEHGFRKPLTIFDRLQKAGVSWKFYVQNYRPEITYRTFTRPIYADQSAQVVWVPLLNFPRFLDDPDLASHIVDLDQYFRDLRDGTLPEVAYIVPSGSSEHPPGSLQSGQRFVRTLIVELMRSTAWSSSAFLWTYDDWGGWYDHVRPPRIDRFGYGFRVPSLLVSAYAKRGHVDSTTLDYTSVLRFIEDNWSLRSLARRDAGANSLMSAFDFNVPPREPVLLPATRGEPDVANDAGKPRMAIFATYGAAISGAAILLLVALPLHRRTRRPA